MDRLLAFIVTSTSLVAVLLSGGAARAQEQGPDVLSEPAMRDLVAPEGDFGDPCGQDYDCWDLYCIQSTTYGGICTSPCIEDWDCPDPWTCREFSEDGGQPRNMCLPPPCAPACEGKLCGPNGCGGICGNCPAPSNPCENAKCSPDGTACWSTHVFDGYACGDTSTCKAGECTPCTPDCKGKQCGSDGCSGVCGTCDWPDWCNDKGQCQSGEPQGGDDVADAAGGNRAGSDGGSDPDKGSGSSGGGTETGKSSGSGSCSAGAGPQPDGLLLGLTALVLALTALAAMFRRQRRSRTHRP
jgi:hypothetical protein